MGFIICGSSDFLGATNEGRSFLADFFNELGYKHFREISDPTTFYSIKEECLGKRLFCWCVVKLIPIGKGSNSLI